MGQGININSTWRAEYMRNVKTIFTLATAGLTLLIASSANATWIPNHQVVVDAYISGDELTETNNGSIKVVEYNTTKINFNTSFDTNSHIFTAPAAGLYNVDARYSQLKCGSRYLLRIGISVPNAAAPGGNHSIGPVTFADIANYGCAIPGIAAVNGVMSLEEGDTLFIQGRYQQAIYDISRWNYKNEYQNRLVITYLGVPTLF
jgi:TusA-related sulfurtransferase